MSTAAWVALHVLRVWFWMAVRVIDNTIGLCVLLLVMVVVGLVVAAGVPVAVLVVVVRVSPGHL